MKKQYSQNILKYTIFCIIVFILFNSCEKEKSIIESNSQKSQLSAEDKLLKDNLQQLAIIVCNTAETIEDYKEIKMGVDISLYYSQDEEFRFIDLISDRKSKFLKSGQIPNNFGKKLLKAIQKTKKLKSFSNQEDDLELFSINNNVQIYWPYSENWNGIETPTITFDPLLPVEENIGYKKEVLNDGTILIDTVIVNEEYCLHHPVWIINQNEIDYDDLPYFVDDEFKSGNVIYMQSNPKLRSILEEDLNNNSKIYEMQVGKVQCTHQYDFIWNGGPDLYFRMIGSKEISANTVIADYFPNHLLAKLTRSDVNNKEIKQYYTPINPDWSPAELDNAFILYEEDGGEKEQTFKGKLTFEISKVKFGCDFEFKYGKKDETIYAIIWERYAYFAGNKGQNDPNAALWDGWRVYKAGEVSWNLPYIIRNKPY
jgi:hypothetical protein